ncbi:hypothetical protein [Tepidiforma sp.]|uniref:hypothetical protein n=1 Tax=Tepidiforma sp. TaxID=2682230 RepID=UPI002ADE88E1|nr:hypothetical protein [Tepidiforma sp.]
MFAEGPGGLPGRFAIAHRAGNEPGALARAAEAGALAAEADLWLHRGRIEVRHTKTAGPLPILWDRWSLHRGWGHRLQLHELLAAAPPGLLLHLDLKGWDDRLGPAAARAMAELAPGRPYLVSAQRWSLLEPFHRVPEALVIHSAGSERKLRQLAAHLAGRERTAVAVHRELVSPGAAAVLRGLAVRVLAWPVNDAALIEPLAALGVNGFITDRLEVVRAVAGGAAGG